MDIRRDGVDPVAYAALTESLDPRGFLRLARQKSAQSQIRDFLQRTTSHASGRTAVDPTYNSCAASNVVQSAMLSRTARRETMARLCTRRPALPRKPWLSHKGRARKSGFICHVDFFPQTRPSRILWVVAGAGFNNSRENFSLFLPPPSGGFEVEGWRNEDLCCRTIT